MNEKLKEELKKIPNLNRTLGAINICTTPESKYFDLRNKIYFATEWIDDIFDSVKLSTRVYAILNDITEWPKCICGLCNNLCIKISSLYYPGHSNRNPDVIKKKKEIFKERYGVSNPSKIQEVKDKKRETCRKNYGVDFPFQSKQIRDIHAKNLSEKYGDNITNAFQIPQVKKHNKRLWIKNKEEILQKRQITQLTNYYNKLKSQLENTFELLFTESEYSGLNKKYKFKCKKCNNVMYQYLLYTSNGYTPRCKKCNPLIDQRGSSNLEESVYKWLTKFEYAISKNDRTIINPLELDFFIPKLNLAIEIHGLYWHTEEQGKDPNYHLNKYNLCKKQGVNLIQIFEDQWHYKQQTIKHLLTKYLNPDILLKKENINIISPDLKTTKYFLIKNSLYTSIDVSNCINIGLTYNNVIISISSFEFKNNTWILKYNHHNLYDYTNILLQSFIKSYPNYNTIITKIDKSYENELDYNKLGFESIKDIPPKKWYVKGNKRYNSQDIIDEESYNTLWDSGYLALILKQ